MGSMAAEELVSRNVQEELCLLPAGILVAERRNNFATRQHSLKLRKFTTNVTNIFSETASVHVKSFIRKRVGKNLKFAEFSNSQRIGRSASTLSADGNVYDLSTVKRRSTKLLYYV